MIGEERFRQELQKLLRIEVPEPRELWSMVIYIEESDLFWLEMEDSIALEKLCSSTDHEILEALMRRFAWNFTPGGRDYFLRKILSVATPRAIESIKAGWNYATSESDQDDVLIHFLNDLHQGREQS